MVKKIIGIIVIAFFSVMLVACQSGDGFQRIEIAQLEGDGTMENPFKVDAYLNEPKGIPLKMVPIDFEASVTVYQGVMMDDGIARLLPPTVLDFDFTGSSNKVLIFTPLSLGTFYIVLTVNDKYQTYIEVEVSRMPSSVDFSKDLKVLAIGNSFSVDAMQYLYKIADDAGVSNIVLGNLYIAGASMDMHVNSFSNNLNNYVYYKNTNDQWQSRASTSLLYGLLDEDWDIITIQQVSGSSGRENTFNQLDTLISIIEQNKTNFEARILWQMTWAYQQNSSHGDFNYYNKDQMTMYQAIVDVAQSKIVPHQQIEKIIPAGTAIQNLRTSYIGDTLTVDGYHLSLVHGRYTAGLSWFKSITGLDIDPINYAPNGITETDLLAIKEAVNNASLTPFAVTPSTYNAKPTDPDVEEPVNMSSGMKLDLDFELGFWNSINSQNLIKSDPISKNFIATSNRLTKSDLPNGTILVIEPGYQYRANFFMNLEGPTDGVRSENITASVVLIDDAWWQGRHYVSFNISMTQTQDITGKQAEVKEKFHVYLPYEIVDFTFSSGFYNSTGSHIQVKTDAISNNFISPERRYSKDEIPVGSIIEIESGYQYRANFYMDLDGGFTNNRRSDNIQTNRIIVDEAWWGNQQYVVFNVSRVGTPNIKDEVELVSSKFRVLVPNHRLIDTEFTLGFYNALGSHQIITSDAISKNFVATNSRFSKSDLPIGSIMIIEPGYQYRANFYMNLDGNLDLNKRADNVSTFMVVIDEAWWGDYEYVSFNISKVTPSDLTDQFDQAASAFIIIK